MLTIRRLKKFMASFLLSTLLSACALNTPPPDIFVFESLDQHFTVEEVTNHLVLSPSPTCMKEIKEPECGHGVSIVSGKTIFVGEKKEFHFKDKPWSQLKRESIYLPAVESYAPLSTWIINTCAKAKCSEDVDRFRIKLDALNGLPSSK